MDVQLGLPQRGRREPDCGFARVTPRIEYDPRTRFVTGGELPLTMESGEQRVIEVETLGDSRLLPQDRRLRRLEGPRPRVMEGPLHVDGEYIADCWADEHSRSLGQFRDTPDPRPRGRRGRLRHHGEHHQRRSGPSSGSPPSPTTR